MGCAVCGSDTVHEAVGYVQGDIYMTLCSHVVDIHDTLHRNGIRSNDTVYVHR